MYTTRVLLVCLSVVFVCAGKIDVKEDDIRIKKEVLEGGAQEGAKKEMMPRSETTAPQLPMEKDMMESDDLRRSKKSTGELIDLTETAESLERTKKSPRRMARFEQFPQNPQHVPMHPPSHTTTVCIVVKSNSHNHPVTLCGPQTNNTEPEMKPMEPLPVAHQAEMRQAQPHMPHMPNSHRFRGQFEQKQFANSPNLIQSSMQKQYPMAPYQNHNPMSSNVPLSINCNLQPGSQYGQFSRDQYNRPGLKDGFVQTMGREIPSPYFMGPDTQRNTGSMYVLPDGSPIEGSNLHLQQTDQQFVQVQNANDKPITHERSWEQTPMLQMTPEYITQQYLQQWDRNYHQQMGRSSDTPMEEPSVSYIPFYFHVNDNQLRSAETPLTEEELRKKAMMQEEEIKQTKKNLDELREKLKEAEDRLAKAAAEKKAEERSKEAPKKEMQKVQEKRQIKG